MRYFIGLCFLLFFCSTQAQDKKAYQLYTGSGKKANYKKLVKVAERSDIVFFGELHNNAIAHWLQKELSQDLYSTDRKMILGAEMFERNQQEALNDFLNGKLDQDSLGKKINLWPNYKTDYAPLVDFAKEQQIPFIATNVPRKYASLVFRKGFEALEDLPQDEKGFLAPLPISYDHTLPGYTKMLQMMPADHGGENLPKAQAIKDATMAFSILEHYQKDALFIHFNGTYHSDVHESKGRKLKSIGSAGIDGIPYYIKQENSNLKMLTIKTVVQSDLSQLQEENIGAADFVLVVDEDMTNTY